jgi:hypothetical protein
MFRLDAEINHFDSVRIVRPEHEKEQASRAVLLMNTFFDSEIYKSCRRYQESMCRLNLEMNHSDSVKIVVHEKEKQPLY